MLFTVFLFFKTIFTLWGQLDMFLMETVDLTNDQGVILHFQSDCACVSDCVFCQSNVIAYSRPVV